MQSNDSTITSVAPDLQWLVCHESYHYLNYTFIKEICCLCIQNGKYINLHVKQFNIFAGDSKIDDTFEIQQKRHGLAWEKGEVEDYEMQCNIQATIDRNATIYMPNTHLVRQFDNWGFQDIQVLKNAPIITNPVYSATWCGKFHEHVGMACAQRNCHNIYTHLKTMMLPYLYTNAFKLEFYNHGSLPVLTIPPQAQQTVTLPPPTYNECVCTRNFIQQSLYKQDHTTPTLQQLFDCLQLQRNAIARSELSVAGADGYDGGLGLAQATANPPTQYQVGETSNQAAGAVDYQIL